MVLSSTVAYVAGPLDSADIAMLRNTAFCSITAFVVVLVGLPKLLMLMFYFLVIVLIAVLTWLYSLDGQKRTAVIGRIKEVCESLIRVCLNDTLMGDGKSKGAEKPESKDAVNEVSVSAEREEEEENDQDFTKLFE